MENLSKRQLELINLSLDIILNEGIQSLTIKNLAARAGFSEPAIYRHFKSKFDILSKLLDYFEEHATKLLSSLEQSGESGMDKIEIFFISRCREFQKNKAFAVIMFSDEIFAGNLELRKKLFSTMIKQKKLIISMIINAQTDGDIREDIPAEHIFITITGSLRFLVTSWKIKNFEENLENSGASLWKSLRTIVMK